MISPRPPMPPPPLRSGPSPAGRALATLIVLLLIVVAVLLYPTFRALNGAIIGAIEGWPGLIGGAIVLLLLFALASVPAMLFASALRLWRKAQQAAIIKSPSGMPIHVRDVPAARARGQDGLAARLLASSLDQHFGAKLAEASREMPQLHSFHQAVTHAPPAVPQIDAGPPIALSGESEWLGWTDLTPHLMVAGRTDSGKTTTVEAILARRITAGDLILVIDPHYQAGKWLGATAVGGGRDYAACYQAFDAARALLDRRYKSFDAGTRTEDFTRVTIIVDEVPAIIAHAQQDKPMLERWLLFATGLGSEARKVRISVILSTQTPLVRDIGISSAMRENFARIALGDTAADLLREEPSGARKQALLDLLRGRPYPAAMEYRNNWYALQNDTIRHLAQTNGVKPRVPTLLITPAAPQQRRVITSGLPPTIRTTPQPAPPTVPFAYTIQEEIVTLLGAQPGRYLTASEIAAALRIDLQVARTEVSALASAGQLTQRKCTGRSTRERTEYAINESTNKPINALAA